MKQTRIVFIAICVAMAVAIATLPMKASAKVLKAVTSTEGAVSRSTPPGGGITPLVGCEGGL